MKLVFFGTGAFAVPTLEAVVEAGHEVLRVFTQPDRAQGRGRALAPSPIKATAMRLQLPLAQPERLTAGLTAGLAPEAGVALDYGKIIPPELLAWPTHGLLGVHPSILPAYRGAAPVPWAILRGETVTGITIFRLVARMDAGDILLQERLPVQPEDDAASLLARAAEAGAELLVHGLELIRTGRATWTPQGETRATLAPKLTKAQGTIDWREPAERISRLIRATIPWPAATTAWQGKPLKIWAARAEAAKNPGAPGTVVSASGDGILVATGHGALRVLELQPAGGKRMSAREFLAGRKMQVGDRLGVMIH